MARSGVPYTYRVGLFLSLRRKPARVMVLATVVRPLGAICSVCASSETPVDRYTT